MRIAKQITLCSVVVFGSPAYSQTCSSVFECSQSAVELLQSAQTTIERQQKQIDDLTSKLNAEISARQSPNVPFTVNGVCFKPIKLTRCYGGDADHMTWLDNANECRNARYNVEGEISILAQC